jgi:hypothetical protein
LVPGKQPEGKIFAAWKVTKIYFLFYVFRFGAAEHFEPKAGFHRVTF